MLRVCGVTFDHTTNYGSCFQAYALKSAVEGIFVGEGVKCSYELIPFKKCSDYPKKRDIKELVVSPWLELHRRQFMPFEKQHMKYAQCTNISQLGALNDVYDAFICGSDVVWSPDFNFGLGAFYLDFADKYAFSYAASFGKSRIDEKNNEQIGAWISRLESISVREKSGAEIARRYTDKPVQVVADPVLLLGKSEWNQLAAPSRKEKPYIFVYTTHLNETHRTFLNQLEKQTGLRIITSTYGPKQALKQGVIQVQTPQRWLQLLRDAEYVVTNSFHATAFSVLYHKKFFTVVHGEKAKGINVRMYDFLNGLGLEERMYSSVPDKIDTSDVNYDGVDEKIEVLRAESIAYLQRNLEAAYQQKLQLEEKEN